MAAAPSEVARMAVDSDEIGTSEVNAALEAWARWGKTVLASLGFPSISIIGRIVELGIVGAAASASGIRALEVDQTCEMVDRAIRSLDETERETIVRTYLYSDNEAAQVTAVKCGLTYGYYRHILARARKMIGQYLERERRQLQCQ